MNYTSLLTKAKPASECRAFQTFREARDCYAKKVSRQRGEPNNQDFAVATSIVCKHRSDVVDRDRHCRRTPQQYLKPARPSKAKRKTSKHWIWIDGFAASGKTTLGQTLELRFPGVVKAVDLDWFTQAFLLDLDTELNCDEQLRQFDRYVVAELVDYLSEIDEPLLVLTGLTEFVLTPNCTVSLVDQVPTPASTQVHRIWLLPSAESASDEELERREVYRQNILRWLQTPARQWVTRDTDPWSKVRPPKKPMSESQVRAARSMPLAEFEALSRTRRLLPIMKESMGDLGFYKASVLQRGHWQQHTADDVERMAMRWAGGAASLPTKSATQAPQSCQQVTATVAAMHDSMRL